VVGELTSAWKASEAPGWQDGDWRSADVYPGDSCPVPSLP